MANNFEGLNGAFTERLRALMAAAPANVGIVSGFRTHDQQAALYAKNPKLAAAPGKSNHESGLAADLSFADSATQTWVHANASRYGLFFPMTWEPWHVEPIGLTRGSTDSYTQPPAGIPAEDKAGSFFDIILGHRAPANVAEMTSAMKQSGGDVMVASGDKGALQQYAKSRFGDYGWSADELSALVDLWDKESGWNPKAQNPVSTAFGIGQFLDTTWAGVGAEKTSDPHGQIDAGLTYIKQRYGSPRAALDFWNGNKAKGSGWY